MLQSCSTCTTVRLQPVLHSGHTAVDYHQQQLTENNSIILKPSTVQPKITDAQQSIIVNSSGYFKSIKCSSPSLSQKQGYSFMLPTALDVCLNVWHVFSPAVMRIMIVISQEKRQNECDALLLSDNDCYLLSFRYKSCIKKTNNNPVCATQIYSLGV